MQRLSLLILVVFSAIPGFAKNEFGDLDDVRVKHPEFFKLGAVTVARLGKDPAIELNALTNEKAQFPKAAGSVSETDSKDVVSLVKQLLAKNGGTCRYKVCIHFRLRGN